MNQKTYKLLYRCFVVLLSNIILGSGTGLLRMTNFGVDPFCGMTLGASYFLREELHLTFMTCGVFQICVNIILILIVIWGNRHYIGFGTIINMFFLGFIADGAEYLGRLLLGSDFSLFGRVLLLIIGILLISIGVGVYSAGDMGMGPYDAIPYIIQEKSNYKLHVRYSRIMTDVFCVILALICAFPVGKQSTVAGIATMVLALGLGPLIYFFRVRLGEHIIFKNFPECQKSREA